METQQTNVYILNHVASMLDRQLDQLLQEQLGIGQSQIKILRALRTQATGSASQRILASHVGQTEASISRQIKILAQKGLLTTHINPKSRRESVVSLTPKAVRLTDAAEQAITRYTQGMFAQLDDKQQALLSETLTLLHNWTCQTGRLTACDHSYDV